MGTNGCFGTPLNSQGAPQIGNPQRYGEYALQYVDYNSDANWDNGNPGDENGDGSIVGDADDEDLGV